jgi:hypothetical protein
MTLKALPDISCKKESPTACAINLCPNCGQAAKEENKIAKYASNEKPINQTEQ